MYAGAINTIVGPSGSGKTTLLKVMNRPVELDGLRVEGRVEFRGRDLLKADSQWVRRQMGIVFQSPNPFPMSTYDNVTFGVRLHWKVSGVSLTGLSNGPSGRSDSMRRSALTLSGGQQQRLRTARALAVRPSVLLLDEPTSSLDPYSKDVIEKLMLRLKSELTLVLVTHDLEQALRVSDYVAFMKFGSIEGWGARRRR